MSKVVIAVGGTGGHLLPAQALAKEMSEEVVFMGPRLSASPYFFKGFAYYDVTSGRRIYPLLKGIYQACKLLKRVKPRLVVGFGSYHSFPIVMAAVLCRIPIALFEPNAVRGRVNRWFARWDLIKDLKPAVPMYHKEKVSRAEGLKYFGLQEGKKTLLIFGGSQGAEVLKKLKLDYQVIQLSRFEPNMHYAWSAADLAICRAGAASVAEHEYYKVPTIFIPYPHATDNHQFENARHSKGCVILEQKNIHLLEEVITKCLDNLVAMKAQLQMPSGQKPNLAELLTPYHLIGIGGIGMSALAHILVEKGCHVSGSDLKPLNIPGVKTYQTQDKKHVPPHAHVVYSTAINKQNPEYRVARNRRDHRSRMLADLLAPTKPLLVAGAHGKTTTSALLAWSMIAAGKDPTYAVGGILGNTGKNGGYGKGLHSVAEADESDGSFLAFPATHAIITNVEAEHLEYWKSESALLDAYRRFIDQVREEVIYCADDLFLREVAPKGISYGFSQKADVPITLFHQYEDRIMFDTPDVKGIEVPMLGRHSALNALSVFLLLTHLGIPRDEIRKAFLSFKGVKRRMEFIGEWQGALIYDDYAHHPTEIAATLSAVKKAMPSKRIVVAYQPHRFSRTRDCFKEYAACFDSADRVLLTDIFSAGEKPIKGINAERLIGQMKKSASHVKRDRLFERLQNELKKGDLLITLGAGDITEVSGKFFT
ncbi:MAG: UDP-N-acetylmuramate--L-alanine ligase [Chlamydiia bacterium]|nr:UDP-N-acetylmuramate--L-alanine ligase [Chlamydiia bacterium]MCH9615187.1 UDP-N-acetylmuramate--L-alanine ligase [Chlamydiia bacterium]MCH9628491.1 UDP-N-acetylmuramate--L-alanine ligase [Chlamydiia bacterium]